MESFFQKYGVDEKVIAVAVSGGADSLALVLQLQKTGKKIVAITVDHGLRGESAQEAEYVAEIMAKNHIEHHILKWEGKKPETGIEEAARQARYKLMVEFCKSRQIKVLAVGHHLRDQAETFLLRLQRGSGVFGLSCMQPVVNCEGIKIIRPQLNKTPEQLKTFLTEKKVDWIEDPMNQDEDFVRVKIRKFLPKLAHIGIDEKKLYETAFVLSKTRAFLQRLVDDFIKNNVRWWSDVVVGVSWTKIKNLDEEVAMPVLGQLLQKVGRTQYSPEAAELARVLAQGNNFRGCTLGKCELFIAAKRLWIVPQDEKNILMTKCDWDDFLKKNPEYVNSGLPYKVRRALWQKFKG